VNEVTFKHQLGPGNPLAPAQLKSEMSAKIEQKTIQNKRRLALLDYQLKKRPCSGLC
jgi:hypothetical protein